MNNLRILLADDDSDEHLFFKDILEALDPPISFSYVFNGVELMEELLDQSNPLPDLIFLDLNMPLKTGLESLREIKKHKRLQNIKIVMYTTSIDPTVVEKTFLLKADFYIRKPESYQKLRSALHTIISNLQSSSPDHRSKENYVLNF